MNLEDMIDAIESTSKKNVWLLVEAETNAISRFKLRATFFQALKVLGEPAENPLAEWED
jgi:hypothetical protein